MDTGPLPNGDFETTPSGGFPNEAVIDGPATIPSWKSNGTVELVESGEKQGGMILIVPQGRHAIRLGNDAEIRQDLKVEKGSIYAITFSAARTCAQLEALNVSVLPASQTIDLQTLYNVQGWDPYAMAFEAEEEDVSLVFKNPGMEDDPTCGPIIDDIAIKKLFTPDPPKDNAVVNAQFEEGPWMSRNVSLGVLLPTNLDEETSALPGWIVESNRAIRYIDSYHYSVPEGKRAVELLSGKEGIISQMVETAPNKQYSLTFALGHAGDKCKQPLAVMAFAGDQAQNIHYTPDSNSTFHTVSLNFTSKAERTRIAFYSVYYNTRTDDMSSLCGPVVDDVRVWFSGARRNGFGGLGLRLGFAIWVVVVLNKRESEEWNDENSPPEESTSMKGDRRRRNQRAGEESGVSICVLTISKPLPPLPPLLSMEGEGGPTASSSPPSPPPPPPHDPDLSPVDSPDDTVPGPRALLSDDDHELEQEHERENHQDQDHDHDQLAGTGGLTEDLKRKIIKQASLFPSLSPATIALFEYVCLALNRRSSLLEFVHQKNMGTWFQHLFQREGMTIVNPLKFPVVIAFNASWLTSERFPIPVIASFRKMKKLIRDHIVIAAALRESSLLVVSPDGKKVKRLHPLPHTEVRDPKLYTVLVENLPEDHSVENIKRIFGGAGNIKNICIRDPHAVEEPSKSNKAEKHISNKLHALVEYETVEAAEKAVATLNNEQDWRNGMRVKILNRMGKYVQRKQTWKPSDSERNHTGLTSDRAGEEENHNSSEHHDDTPDEEASCFPLSIGHGTSWSSHAHEPSKPPPGPRMPDGTRGFTMGRGRPPVTDQS
ncbi:hypothetical protein FNV43_RR06001 [Rhamnella rubrinervis]|uniref:Uncharacterized protein n=1 Tax=Rhamnella rubrinervis TaxID=2594499 RepID=A0A8K0HCA3_9ROSA|nr:hypothetical protein FNV43_RR06001 [Rhamnella rubrinervis]